MTSPTPSLRNLVYTKIHALEKEGEVKLRLGPGKEYSLSSMRTIIADALAHPERGEVYLAERLIGQVQTALTPLKKGAFSEAVRGELRHLAADIKALEFAKRMLPAKAILAAAQAQVQKPAPASTYEAWKLACEQLDLAQVCEQLETVCKFTNPQEAKSAFQKMWQDRDVELVDTDLHYSREPESACNKLLVEMAQTLFGLSTMGELVQLLYPKVNFTFDVVSEGRKPALAHKQILEAEYFTASDPISAAKLGSLLVLGDTAIFADDFSSIPLAQEKKQLTNNFWLPMQSAAPGLKEMLDASNTSLQVDENKHLRPITPTLREMISTLRDAFRKFGASGLGSEKLANAGASIALENFSRDWTLFSDLHNTPLGGLINQILTKVRTGYRNTTGCVNIAASSLDSILSANNSDVLTGTRMRPEQTQQLPENLPALEKSLPLKLPYRLAALCGPEIDSIDTLIPYLVDMPPGTYAPLLSHWDPKVIFDVLELSDLLSEGQKTALSDAVTEVIDRSLAQPGWQDLAKAMATSLKRQNVALFLQILKTKFSGDEALLAAQLVIRLVSERRGLWLADLRSHAIAAILQTARHEPNHPLVLELFQIAAQEQDWRLMEQVLRSCFDNPSALLNLLQKTAYRGVELRIIDLAASMRTDTLFADICRVYENEPDALLTLLADGTHCSGLQTALRSANPHSLQALIRLYSTKPEILKAGVGTLLLDLPDVRYYLENLAESPVNKHFTVMMGLMEDTLLTLEEYWPAVIAAMFPQNTHDLEPARARYQFLLDIFKRDPGKLKALLCSQNGEFIAYCLREGRTQIIQELAEVLPNDPDWFITALRRPQYMPSTFYYLTRQDDPLLLQVTLKAFSNSPDKLQQLLLEDDGRNLGDNLAQKTQTTVALLTYMDPKQDLTRELLKKSGILNCFGYALQLNNFEAVAVILATIKYCHQSSEPLDYNPQEFLIQANNRLFQMPSDNFTPIWLSMIAFAQEAHPEQLKAHLATQFRYLAKRLDAEHLAYVYRMYNGDKEAQRRLLGLPETSSDKNLSKQPRAENIMHLLTTGYPHYLIGIIQLLREDRGTLVELLTARDARGNTPLELCKTAGFGDRIREELAAILTPKEMNSLSTKKR